MANYDSDSNVVKQVQTAINAAGYQPPLTVDGSYGPKTKAGVMWYQGQHGLTQDGVIGDQTVAATIAPTPAQSAALQAMAQTVAQLQSLQSGQPVPPHLIPPPGDIPIPGTVLTTTPVIHMAAVAAPHVAAAMAPAGVSATTFMPPTAPLAVTPAPSQLPSWAGTAGGLAAGLAGGFALGQLALGALIGGGVGAVIDFMRKQTPGATMHGELGKMGQTWQPDVAHRRPRPHHHVPHRFGMDVNMDDVEGIIAGDMGCSAPSRTLKG